jgi:hypothetical protein
MLSLRLKPCLQKGFRVSWLKHLLKGEEVYITSI